MSELPEKLFTEYQYDNDMIHVIDKNGQIYLSCHKDETNEQVTKTLLYRYNHHEELLEALKEAVIFILIKRCKQHKELVEALKTVSLDRLRGLANWFDAYDSIQKIERSDEVQRDLRAWADTIEEVIYRAEGNSEC